MDKVVTCEVLLRCKEEKYHHEGGQMPEQVAQRCWRLAILREIQKPVWQPDLVGPALRVGRRREAFQNGSGR